MDPTVKMKMISKLKADYEGFSPRLRVVAKYIVDNPGDFGLDPIRVTARKAGVSTYTLVRMAQYLGFGDDLGSVDVGKMADFFLVPGDPTTDLKAIKTISLVTKDGTFYFPTQVYPEFGIKPFTEVSPIQE